MTHESEIDPRNEEILIHVNGELKPKSEAMVSVYDSGFLLGDGIWEGLRLYQGKWVFLDDHLDRLFEAALVLDLDLGLDRQGVVDALEKTRIANGMETDVHARIMFTRGRKAKPFQHPGFSRWGPTIVMILEHSQPAGSLVDVGVKLATVPQVRGLPMSQDPKLNSHSKLNCVLACVQAEKVGADEALMLDPHGFVNTSNACNFFIVRKGEVWTSTGDYCMNGITRAKTIQACRNLGIPVYEKNFSLVETYGADEAFLTGTFGGQTWVSEIDGRAIGSEAVGPVTQEIRQEYKRLVTHDVDAR
ncbi:MAG: aminotransferase class IV [Verrucomicrobiota bacterium]